MALPEVLVAGRLDLSAGPIQLQIHSGRLTLILDWITKLVDQTEHGFYRQCHINHLRAYDRCSLG